jgi:uncharacterized protein with von Willebrand factor type A (vWA) domain
MLTENDLVVEDTQYKSQMSTVLMIDISQVWSLVRRIVEKKVAMLTNKISRHIRHMEMMLIY